MSPGRCVLVAVCVHDGVCHVFVCAQRGEILRPLTRIRLSSILVFSADLLPYSAPIGHDFAASSGGGLGAPRDEGRLNP